MKISNWNRPILASMLSIAALLFVACGSTPPLTSTQPQVQKTNPLTAEELNHGTIHRRAVDAAIWGLGLACNPPGQRCSQLHI
jgi:hypothetical protein